MLGARVLALLALAAGAVLLPAPSAASAPVRNYIVVRVDTGATGGLPSDARVRVGVARAQRFWRSVPGAPTFTFTVIPGVAHAPHAQCDMDTGRQVSGARQDDGVIAFMPPDWRCFSDGDAHATPGGLDVESSVPDWPVIAHELGHNFGLDHDRAHDPLLPGDLSEYGNPFSIMGGGQGPPSAPSQIAAGWLTSTPLPRGHTARIRDLSLPGAARAWRFWHRGHLYVLEYRARRADAATLGPSTGVVLYRDGFVIETTADVYVLPRGKVFRLGGGQGVLVAAVGRTYALVRRLAR